MGVFLDDIVHFQAAPPQAAKNGSPAGRSADAILLRGGKAGGAQDLGQFLAETLY